MSRRMLVPAVIAGACALVLFAVSFAGSGAFWTAPATASSADVGVGEWCATPDPAESGAQYIRLSSIATNVGTNTWMAIVPVANNAAWGGGTGTKTLGVELWGCQTAPVGSLRVTAWSNPSTAVADSWLAGSTTSVAPTSRLDPSTGLGAQLKGLALAATVTASKPLVGTITGALRQYSWLIANGRTSAAPTSDPAACNYLLSVTANCSDPLTNSSNTDSTFTQLFNTSPWAAGALTPTTYSARTYATESASGWGASGAWLDVNCTGGILSCTAVGNPTTLAGTAASDATLLASTNGNQMQWVVVEWTATTAPPSDLVLQVVLQ